MTPLPSNKHGVQSYRQTMLSDFLSPSITRSPLPLTTLTTSQKGSLTAYAGNTLASNNLTVQLSHHSPNLSSTPFNSTSIYLYRAPMKCPYTGTYHQLVPPLDLFPTRYPQSASRGPAPPSSYRLSCPPPPSYCQISLDKFLVIQTPSMYSATSSPPPLPIKASCTRDISLTPLCLHFSSPPPTSPICTEPTYVQKRIAEFFNFPRHPSLHTPPSCLPPRPLTILPQTSTRHKSLRSLLLHYTTLNHQRRITEFSLPFPVMDLEASQGHSLATIDPSTTFQLFLQNPNGLSTSTQPLNQQMDLSICHNYGTAAICMPESNTNWDLTHLQEAFWPPQENLKNFHALFFQLSRGISLRPTAWRYCHSSLRQLGISGCGRRVRTNGDKIAPSSQLPPSAMRGLPPVIRLIFSSKLGSFLASIALTLSIAYLTPTISYPLALQHSSPLPSPAYYSLV